MKYKFSEIDQRVNRNLYMYSKFEGKVFLKNYIESRKKIKKKIKLKEDLKLVKKEKNLILLKKLEYQFQNNLKSFKFSIENLTRSFEVNKKIFLCYDNNWKKVSKKEISLNTYILLSFYFSWYFEKFFCLKVLNCLLKLNDYILFRLKKKYISKSFSKYNKFYNFICRFFSSFIISNCIVTSRAVVGSSAINKSGLLAMLIAIITLCLCPPDNSYE